MKKNSSKTFCYKSLENLSDSSKSNAVWRKLKVESNSTGC